MKHPFVGLVTDVFGAFMDGMVILAWAIVVAVGFILAARAGRWIYHWLRELIHKAILQDELDEAERVGKARDERARAFMQAASKRRT